MKRDKWLKVRLSVEELERLKAHAESRGWDMSLAVREWIRKLPRPNAAGDTGLEHSPKNV